MGRGHRSGTPVHQSWTMRGLLSPVERKKLATGRTDADLRGAGLGRLPGTRAFRDWWSLGGGRDKSVGVQPYSGTAGRIENCQVGVFLVTLLDRELYLRCGRRTGNGGRRCWLTNGAAHSGRWNLESPSAGLDMRSMATTATAGQGICAGLKRSGGCGRKRVREVRADQVDEA